jgi:hypothetical protein
MIAGSTTSSAGDLKDWEAFAAALLQAFPDLGADG